jgi:hypothetical protein
MIVVLCDFLKNLICQTYVLRDEKGRSLGLALKYSRGKLKVQRKEKNTRTRKLVIGAG